MKCENCNKTQLDEPFWTSRKTGKTLTVCADCLYNLDGIDHRGQSLGTALKELEHRRAAEWVINELNIPVRYEHNATCYDCIEQLKQKYLGKLG